MAGKIPESFIQDLLSRVDLVDLIDARIPLKRSGANFIALCPFHGEKTPSFSVSRERQFYYCFGCGARGTAIGFLMEYDRLTFPEAVEHLADAVGVSVPKESSASTITAANEPNIERVYEATEHACRYYQDQLKNHEAADRAVEYLKKRGVSGQLARDYRLGYAPPGYHNLPDVISRETMLAAGLVTAKGGGPSYDWFRDRIMYPIRDRRGRIVGFGGRVIGSGTPKYLNSPESAIFKKSREVYGLYELLNAVRAPEFVLVVEGYMDVIALAQHGITNAVATLGTATSPDHVKLLFRYTRDLVFCFDGDAAGRAAAFKAMQSSLPLLRDGWQVRILTLPEGHDPDSLVREEGKQRFLERTRLAQPLSEFFFERLAEGLNLASLEGRAALVAKAQPLIEKLHPGVFRSLVEQRLSELVGRRWIEKIDKPSMLDAGGRYENSVRKHVKSAVHSFLTLLVTFPHLSRELDFEAKARLTGIEKYGPVIRKVIDYIATAPNATSAGILEAFRGQPEEQYIARLMAAGGQLQSDGAATIADEFRDYVRYLTDFRSKVDRLELLIEKSRKAVLSAEEREELRSLTSV